jgi:transcriptional regulator with XRE-family HTH domain
MAFGTIPRSKMIGPTIRRLRQERDLSQERLATSAQVSSGYLSKLERGVYKQPSFEVLSRIATALQIPVAELYRAAGLEHLLVEADPSLEPVLEGYAARLHDLPKRDRDLIMSEIHRIIKEEG